MKEIDNQLHPELLSITSYNSFTSHISSSRSYMSSSHLSQRLVTDEPDEKFILSGVEIELAKYTFNTKMPDDGTIVAVIDRYPTSLGKDSLNFNPETIVIYERHGDKRLDYFTLKYHNSTHQFFGFKYKNKETVSKLVPGSNIEKDTIFADSPSVSDKGVYNYGHNFNTAFMSIPGVAEDGFVVSQSLIDSMNFRIYERRVVEFGTKQFPLNIHGGLDNYKVFPDIGDRIDETRKDGLLLCLRDYPKDLTPALMSKKDVMMPDFIFDKCVYVKGGKGRVVDIKVYGNNFSTGNLPEEVTEQLDKYKKAYLDYHRRIVEVESNLRLEYRKKYGIDYKLNLSPKLHSLIVESYAMLNEKHSTDSQNLNLLHRQESIDEYRVEITVEYELKPTIGTKLTNTAGGKGVICKILPDEDMPVDENGVRADIIVDPTSIISRINLGVLYEHYINSANVEVKNIVKNILGIVNETTINELSKLPDEIIGQAFRVLLDYFSIINYDQYVAYSKLNDNEVLESLLEVVNKGVFVFIPTNNKYSNLDIVKEIEAKYKPHIGPVTYRNDAGELVKTKKPVRIAPIYYILLDKIADKYNSVSTARLQHFGILTPITKSEKFTMPFNCTATRIVGETEGRLLVGYCGEEAVAEIMDRNNNPRTQRNIAWNILTAEIPTNIYTVVDRKLIPLGGAKNIQLVKHMMYCNGFLPVYEPSDY